MRCGDECKASNEVRLLVLPSSEKKKKVEDRIYMIIYHIDLHVEYSCYASMTIP